MLDPLFGFVQTATGSTEQTQRTEGESDNLTSTGVLLQLQQTDGAAEKEAGGTSEEGNPVPEPPQPPLGAVAVVHC